MTLHEGTIKVPRKRPQIRAALDLLAGLGATDVAVTRKRHIRVRWRIGGTAMSISVAGTPRNMDDCIQITRQLIRRRIREAALH